MLPATSLAAGDDDLEQILALQRANLESTIAERADGFVTVQHTLFAKLDALQPVARFYVMGQVCVAPSHRGTGVFDALYRAHRVHYATRFDCLVTEIATRNGRSMRAHERVGFETLHTYRDDVDEWAIVVWRW